MQTSATRTVVVNNEQGLHARAAMAIAQTVRRFEAKVELVKSHQRVEATEILQILSLGADSGTQLVIEAHGLDAEQALEAVVQLFSDNFGEE